MLRLLSFLLLLSFSTQLRAQGTETFSNIPAASSSYTLREWNGDNSLPWSATDARTDSSINGRTIMIRNGVLTCNNIPNGISSLSFKHKQFFSGNTPVLEVFINGTLIGKANPTASIETASFTGINVSGNFKLEIKQVTAGLRIGIDDVTWTALNTTPCSVPAAQATALNLTPAQNSISGNFTASPSASGYLVVRSTASSLTATPADGTVYNPGQSLGGGTVVASVSGTTFNATGLNHATNYHFFIFAYNNSNCSGGPLYLTATPLTGNATTPAAPSCVAPTAAPTALSFSRSNTSLTGRFTASSSANNYLVVMSSSASLSQQPQNGTTYSTGQTLGGGTVLQFSNTTSFTANNLTANTTYHFFIFAANIGCTGEPAYLAAPLSGSQSTTNFGNSIPPGYYNAANGLTCETLKTAVYNIISNNTNSLAYDDLLTAYPKTDKRRNDANTADIVWDMYSDNPTGADPYTFTFVTDQCGNYSKEGDCYNREHTFPQSWFNDALPMRSDIHQVFPTDGFVNGIRSSFPYGETSAPTRTTQNGGKLGPGTAAIGYTKTVFEPINEYKGDFARAQLYMATRYQNLISDWRSNGTADEVLNGTSYQVYDDWFLKLMYKWHLQDPVSEKELARNDSAFAIQGNRNPFVDRPEWVAAIWSCTGLLGTTGLNDIISGSENRLSLYPNPVYRSTVTISLHKTFTHNTTLQVMDLAGKLQQQIVLPAGQKQIQFSGTQFSKGMYILKLNSKQGILTTRFMVQ